MRQHLRCCFFVVEAAALQSQPRLRVYSFLLDFALVSGEGARFRCCESSPGDARDGEGVRGLSPSLAPGARSVWTRCLWSVENLRLWTSREESPPRDREDCSGEQSHWDPSRPDPGDRVLSAVAQLGDRAPGASGFLFLFSFQRGDPFGSGSLF